jgi:cytochrome b561
LFQVLGFVLIIAAVLLVQFGKKIPGWYRWHKRLAHTGAVLIIIALGIGVAMVELSGGPHIRVPHAALGITTLALLVLTILLGYAKEKIRPPKLYLRKVHIAAGLVTILFLVVTIIIGLMTAGVI